MFLLRGKKKDFSTSSCSIRPEVEKEIVKSNFGVEKKDFGTQVAESDLGGYGKLWRAWWRSLGLSQICTFKFFLKYKIFFFFEKYSNSMAKAH